MPKRGSSKWERIRTKGKWRFIVLYGVLGWGVTTGFLFAVVFPFALSMASSRATPAKETHVSFWGTLPLSLILFPIGGIAWGLFMWSANEKAYRNATGSQRHERGEADGLRNEREEPQGGTGV